MTKVSVIINNFNYGNFVGDAIDSAISQTYPNIEVIVVDDGSLDNSKEVISLYSERVKPIFKENGGQASALNLGFSASNGDIIIFLDADDVMYPDCVATVVSNWQGAAVKTHFNLDLIDGLGRPIGRSYNTTSLPEGDVSGEVLARKGARSMPMSGNAFSRKLLEIIMPIPAADWKRGADVYLFTLAALNGRVGAINKPLGSYRSHGQNRSLMVVNGRLSGPNIKARIVREQKTEKIITKFLKNDNSSVGEWDLMSSLAHFQQLYIYNRIFGIIPEYEYKDQKIKTVKALKITFYSELQIYKKFIISLWMLSVRILPLNYAELIAILGYRTGFMVGVSKVQSQRTAVIPVPAHR